MMHKIQDDRSKQCLQDKDIYKQCIGKAVCCQHGARHIVYASHKELRLAVVPSKIDAFSEGHIKHGTKQ